MPLVTTLITKPYDLLESEPILYIVGTTKLCDVTKTNECRDFIIFSTTENILQKLEKWKL